jgi:hypothetical protein
MPRPHSVHSRQEPKSGLPEGEGRVWLTTWSGAAASKCVKYHDCLVQYTRQDCVVRHET